MGGDLNRYYQFMNWKWCWMTGYATGDTLNSVIERLILIKRKTLYMVYDWGSEWFQDIKPFIK